MTGKQLNALHHIAVPQAITQHVNHYARHCPVVVARTSSQAQPEARRPAAKKSANCLSQAIAGTAIAIATPRKQIWSDERLRPARKAPSASSIKSTRPVAGAGMNC